MNKQKPNILFLETYLAFIKNSVGSKAYQNLYLSVNGRKKDILENGQLSCAYFVSSVLLMFNLIKRRHATVKSTISDMRSCGWRPLDLNKLKPGCVLLWKEEKFDSGYHQHLGFYIGWDKAVSTSFSKKIVFTHHFSYKGRRGVEAAFWHPQLSKRYLQN